MYVSSHYDGYFDGRVYFGTGGSKEEKSAAFCDDSIHIRVGVCGEEIPQIDCSEPIVEPSCTEFDLTTEEGCKAEALARGLTWNDEDQVFAGDWEANGCFEYVSSYYND